MKTCTKCSETKPFTGFFARKMSKDGYQPICKACDTRLRKARKDADPEKERAIQLRWRTENAERKRDTDRRLYAENKSLRKLQGAAYYLANRDACIGRQAAWLERNADYIRAHRQQYRLQNIDRVRALRKEHYTKNKAAYVAHARKREIAKLGATPAWADLELIKSAYLACDFLNMVTGVWHNVDHVIPIKHKLVCGLHVHNNLQVITEAANLSKSNYFEIK